MKIFYDLAIKTKRFVNQYKNQDSTNSSAAQIAAGSVLTEDAFFGIRNPISGKKRIGILPTLILLVISIPLLLSPIIGPMLVGVKNLNSQTTATITSVEFIQEDIGGENSASSRECNITAVFNVGGQQILSQALYPSNEYCRLGASQVIPIKYDSVNPSTWAYNIADYSSLYRAILYVGLTIFIISLLKLIIRASSGIYGLSLKRKGYKNAKEAREAINLESINNEVYDLKTEFVKSIFGINLQPQQNITSAEDQINQSAHRVLSSSEPIPGHNSSSSEQVLNPRPGYSSPNQDIVRPNISESPRPKNNNINSQDNIDINLDLD